MRDHGRGTGWLFGLYLMLAGTERFLIEFLRAKDDRYVYGFTLAQVTSVTVVSIGALLVWAFSKRAGVRVEQLEALKPAPSDGQSHRPTQKRSG